MRPRLSPRGVEPGGSKQCSPDWFDAQGADVLFAPGYTAPLLSPKPIVVAIHDVSFAAHPEWFSAREGLRRRTLTRLSARRAARVLTISEFSKREITNRLGVDPASIDVVYPGVAEVAGDTLRSAHTSPPTILYVGSLLLVAASLSSSQVSPLSRGAVGTFASRSSVTIGRRLVLTSRHWSLARHWMVASACVPSYPNRN